MHSCREARTAAPAPDLVVIGDSADLPRTVRSARECAYDRWLDERPSPLRYMPLPVAAAALSPGVDSTPAATPPPEAAERVDRTVRIRISVAASPDIALAITVVMEKNGCRAHAAAELIRGRADALGVPACDVEATIADLSRAAMLRRHA